MGRKAEISLYRLFEVDGKHRYIRIVRKGRSWAPRIEPTGKPGSYYLRYSKNGKRTFESVGDDLQIALQELKARQASLNSPTPLTIIPQRKTLTTEIQAFLARRPKSWRYILGVFGDFYGWDKDPASFEREDFQTFAAHLAKLLPANKECLAPRTQRNYLKNLLTFLRSTGRVVIVVRNEQDVTIAKATAVIPNTLVLTRHDFPKVNKKVKDFYPQSIVDAMFAACKNLRELVMLALFYYTGCREDEVAHLRWTDIRWEAKELFVREWWKDNWTTKTYEDRIVEMPDQLIGILKKPHGLLNDPARYRKEGWLFRGKSSLILPNMLGRPDGSIAAAYYSYQKGMTTYSYTFFSLGGFGPLVSALVFTWRSKSQALKHDFLDRLVNPRRFSLPYLPVTLLLPPCVAYTSVLISEYFARPASQLTLVPPVLAWAPLMFVGPALEELGWRGYGMDALRSKLGMLNATILFGVLWALWHAPMFFINHTYQHDLWLMSPIYVTNFFVGTIPLAVVANWLYYKHNRLILAAILFHCVFDAVAEGLNIQQFTKCIITVVSLAVALVIVLVDRKEFRQGPKTFLTEEAVIT